MTLDALYLITFFGIFIRCSAMVLSCPLYGNVIPVTVRVFFSLVVSLALVPVLSGHFTSIPESMYDLAALAFGEAAVGLIIGFSLQLLVAVFQMAGMILDLQIGLGSAQMFNPSSGSMSSPIGQFKFWLSIVLILVLNGHQMMFQAFVKSYDLSGLRADNLASAIGNLTSLFGNLMVLAIQIAAPVVAVTVVIDVASGLINKAVPQTQPFLLSLPAKIALGMIVLAFGLPMLVGSVDRGLDMTFLALGEMLGG